MDQIKISTKKVSHWCSGWKSLMSGKKWKNWERAGKTKQNVIKIEQNLSKDRAMHKRDNSSFWNEFFIIS
jgi:hypothetical protein